MADFKVLLVEDAPETILILQSVLEFKDFKWILARSSQEATEMLNEHCPHLLIVDISLGPEDDGLAWLQSIKKGPFAHIPAIVMTSSAFRGDVQRSKQLNVEDYILKPADHTILTQKIHLIRKKLKETPVYSYKGHTDKPLAATISLQAKIRAISETGLCLSTGVSNFSPFALPEFETDFFSVMGVPAPHRITLFNCEREVKPQDGLLYRNFCQVQGWQEKDLQKVRLWIRREKLERLF